MKMKTRHARCPTEKSNAGALSPRSKCARVVIADPYPVIRNGLATVLEAEPDFRIVAHCADSASCIEAIRKFLPDIAIVDESLPDISGLEILAVARSEGLPTQIVFFTALAERELHLLGVHAVVRKDADPQSLLQCLRQVASGQKILQPQLYGQAGSGQPGGNAEKAITALTDRERQIMRLVSEGQSNKEIGRRLKISDGTIKVHLHHIFQKLQVGNRTSLAALYLDHDSGKTLGRAPASLNVEVRSMDDFIARANIDHFLGLLNRTDLTPHNRGAITKLLIAEEDKLGRDLESLQFAEARTATSRERVNRFRKLRDSFVEGSSHRAHADGVLTNFEAIQNVMERFCRLMRETVNSRAI
jgi:two-component system, NarL family, nitrate/nitrite response regulator NarL